jgi:hypothetical protein
MIFLTANTKKHIRGRGFFASISVFCLMSPTPAAATCYDDAYYDHTLSCSEQYADCSSCIGQSGTSCEWCSSTSTCMEEPVFDGDPRCPETAYNGWCPAPTTIDNPPFNNESCIFVTYEFSLCTQKVDMIGCTQDFLLNYCSPQYGETNVLLCNGATASIRNGEGAFDMDIGTVAKNPETVRVNYYPDLWYSGCYKFHFEPVTDAIICLQDESGDSSTMLKYSLTMQEISVSSPTEPTTVVPATDAPALPATDIPVVEPTAAPVVAPTDATTNVPVTDAPGVAPTDVSGVPETDAPTAPSTTAPGVPETDAPGMPETDAPGMPATNAPAATATTAPPAPAPTSPLTTSPAAPATDAPLVAPTLSPTSSAAPTVCIIHKLAALLFTSMMIELAS